MTFSVDDYERAITRIFDTQGHVVGTGFLVAPGYVLTCAHVVLQALGRNREQFADDKEPPKDGITLDFHVLASGQGMEAKVVAWLPYRLDSGDVAALRLTAGAPEGVKPIPLVNVTRAEVEAEAHSVYGFGGGPSGGRSDAYRPKANVAGGRFQLCKFGDPSDETIRSGFSGAPVWNEDRKCVIGMVATAVVPQKDQPSSAYAITSQGLQPVLDQIEAFTLQDVLQQGLDACADEDDRYQLKNAIESTLRRCNPNGRNRSWRDQLLDLALDRAPVLGWEQESPLIHFAVMLAWIEGTPGPVYDQIEAWVERHHLSFAELLARLTRAMKQKKIAASTTFDHVMVTVEPVEGQSQDDWRVSIWAMAAQPSQAAAQIPTAIVQDTLLTLNDLPEFIQRQCRKRFGKKNVPLIHVFVPRSLLGCNIEMQPFGSLQDMLGSTYPFVIRTNLTAHPIGQWYYDDWCEKWEDIDFEKPAHEEFKAVDCAPLAASDLSQRRNLMDELANQRTAILKCCGAVTELFELLAEERDSALPVALWTRDTAFEGDLPTLLDEIMAGFPDRVQRERARACPSNPSASIGHHLSLVWEDPTVVPPDMLPDIRFDP